jgi:hypothetical protein
VFLTSTPGPMLWRCTALSWVRNSSWLE